MELWARQTINDIEAAFTADYCRAIAQVSDLLVTRFQAGKTLLICGNGGSAANAQHIAAELVGRFMRNRPGLPAIALPANVATLTAWCNDHEFDTVFSRQVETFGKPGDMLWGISTSGKSANVLKALKVAQDMEIATIGMAGNDGGMMPSLVDYPLFISNRFTPRIQEIHLITYHRICGEVETQLFPESSGK